MHNPYDWRGPLLLGDTRLQAHRAIQPHLSRLQWVVFEAFRIYRHEGLTTQQCEAVTGLEHTTCSARVNELVRDGRLVDSGERRKTRSGRSAVVYRVRGEPPGSVA
jgi:hypothetical protein